MTKLVCARSCRATAAGVPMKFSADGFLAEGCVDPNDFEIAAGKQLAQHIAARGVAYVEFDARPVGAEFEPAVRDIGERQVEADETATSARAQGGEQNVKRALSVHRVPSGCYARGGAATAAGWRGRL